ncbi:MAG: FAD:protein FMN transferase [Leptotrichiaceae bacterium]|nr:FAD:protein FMN transferase [Leptotrichiaceae bacterium]
MDELYKVQTRFLFHSNIKIKIPDKYEESFFDEFFSILENINKMYNSYSENSFIDRINKNAGKFVKVNDRTVEMLERILYFSDILEGEYDITIMPLIKLWGFYKANVTSVPDREKIEEIKKTVDYKKIKINKINNEVKIDAGQEIITGSFIKSYAIDRLSEKMKEKGITDAVINAGGSSILSINNNENQNLGIIIENPNPHKNIEKDPKGYPSRITDSEYRGNDEYNDLFDIEISNEAYSTSNQINTYIEINGEKYGHIISPKTGYPGKNRQIGIITEKAFDGDIISTGLFNQSPENFQKIIKRLSKEMKVEGYLIDGNGKIHYSENFSDYMDI